MSEAGADRPGADHPSWGGLPVVTRLADAAPRRRVRVTGRVTAAAAGRAGGSRAYLCVLDDGTAKVTLAFSGRNQVPGLAVGTLCRIDGTACQLDGFLTVLNPSYDLLGENGCR